MRDDLWVGLRCVWKHKPRGGYGFVIRVPVTVLALYQTQAWVKVEGTGKTAIVLRTSLTTPANMTNVRVTAEIEPRTKEPDR